MKNTKVKTSSKSEIKRKKILEAATYLFINNSYAATSMDLVAQRAEVSKQTVYSHFGSKDELFTAAIEQKCDSYRMVDFMLDDLADPKTALYTLAQRFLTMLTSKEALAVHRTCAYEAKSNPKLSELFFQAGPERITNRITEFMALLNKRKILKIENPRFAALQFLSLIKGEIWIRVEFNTKHQLSQSDIDAYLMSSVELFMLGYCC